MKLVAVTAVLLAAATRQVATTFTSGCSVWYIHGRETLTTQCWTWNPDMGKVLANLDLNNCIGVDSTANAMVWMAGGNAFAIHCGNCGMQNSEVVMECDCIDPRTGDTTTSSIDLNAGLTNQHDGSLTCS